MSISANDQRKAFSHYLRTGRWPRPYGADGRELKFNPYHDPRNGRFTFAPGGSRLLANVSVSDRRTQRLSQDQELPPQQDGVGARFQLAGATRGPRLPRGGNARAFHDPMTLEQVFPRLREAPGGSVIALADNIFDFTGPARAAIDDLARNWTDTLVAQIKAIDSNYRLDTLGSPTTVDGQANQLNALRFERAAAFLRVKGELRPLQVETLRVIQQSADHAFERGLALLDAGRLDIRLSREEALGNYIDRIVRLELRDRYGQYGIEAVGNGSVRVNRRENDSSGSELSFRRPDARVGNVAFDVTLTAKNLKTPQVRGFFGTDFRPEHVVIIRPSQLGEGSTYIISRPEK